ncbi:MAG: hypothetical protein LBM08_09095 [Dysgonamonadaceae bacterium]|jgi:hypothetical protein|nr:hypothetical protein [Dysgonamonadaceae bacterium]
MKAIKRTINNLLICLFLLCASGIQAQNASINWKETTNPSFAADVSVGSSQLSYIEFYFEVETAAIASMKVEVVLPRAQEAFDVASIQKVGGSIDLGNSSGGATQTLSFTVSSVPLGSIVHYRIPRYSKTQANNTLATGNVTVRVYKDSNNKIAEKLLAYNYKYAKLNLIDPSSIPEDQVTGLEMKFGDNHGGVTQTPAPQTFRFRIQCVDGSVDSATIAFTYLQSAITLSNWTVGSILIPAGQITETQSGTTTLLATCTVKIRKSDFPSGNGISEGELVPVSVDVTKATCGSSLLDYLTSWAIPTSNTTLKTATDVSKTAGITFSANQGNGTVPNIKPLSATWSLTNGKLCLNGSPNSVVWSFTNTGNGEARNIRVLCNVSYATILDPSSIEVKTGANTLLWKKPVKTTVPTTLSTTNNAINPQYRGQPVAAYVDLDLKIQPGDTLFVKFDYFCPADFYVYQYGVSTPTLYSYNPYSQATMYYTDACGENLTETTVGNSSSNGARINARISSYDSQVSFVGEDDIQTFKISSMAVGHFANTWLSSDNAKAVFRVALPKGIEFATGSINDIKVYRPGNDPVTTAWPVYSLDISPDANSTVYTFTLRKADRLATTDYEYSIEIQLKNTCPEIVDGQANGEIRIFVYLSGTEGNGCLDVKYDGVQIYPNFVYACKKEGVTYSFDRKRLSVGLKDANRDGKADTPLEPVDPNVIKHDIMVLGDTLRYTWGGKVLTNGDATLYAVLLSSSNADVFVTDGISQKLELNGTNGQIQATLINAVYPAGNTYAGYAMPRDRGSALAGERYAYAWEITKLGGGSFTANDSITFAVNVIAFPNISGTGTVWNTVTNWFYITNTSLLQGITDNNAKMNAVLTPGNARKGEEKYTYTLTIGRPYANINQWVAPAFFNGIQTQTINPNYAYVEETIPRAWDLPYEYRHLSTLDSVILEVPEGYEIAESTAFLMVYTNSLSTTTVSTANKTVSASLSHLNLPHRKVFVFRDEVFDVNHTGESGKWHLPSGYYYVHFRNLAITSTYGAPVGQTYATLTAYADNHTYTQGIVPKLGRSGSTTDYAYKRTNYLTLQYTDLGSVKATINGSATKEALTSRISWNIDLQNTATDMAAYNAWLYVQGPVDNAMFIIGDDTCHSEGQDNRWIQLPALAKSGVATQGRLVVENASPDCNNQTVTVYPLYDRTKGEATTWRPSDAGIAMTDDGFTAAQTDLDKKKFIYAKLTLTINNNVTSRLTGSISPLATTPASPVNLTDGTYGATTIEVQKQFPLEIAVSTLGASGSSVDTRVLLNVPAGLRVIADSVYLEIDGISYRIDNSNGATFLASLASLNGTAGAKNIELKLSDINLPALSGTSGEITGQKTVYLRLKLEPTCDVNTSAPRIEVSFSGKRPCGEDINTGGKVYYSSYLPLSGMSSSLTVEVLNPVIATVDFSCHQSDTLVVKFRKTTDPTVSVAVTDSVSVIVPKALYLKDATAIVYSLPEGVGGSSVPAQSGTVDPSTIRARIDGDTRVIAWPLPKGYYDALQSGGGSGTVQSEHNEYKICLQMDDPEDYFEGNIQAGIITGASLKTGVCENTSLLTEVHTISVITRAAQTVWAGSDADWNLAANWTNGVPGACTDAEISASPMFFPVLADTTARVNAIHFPFGTEIGGIPYLNYNRATVDLTVTSNRWYLLSSPFMDMYSGDYILGSTRNNPAVYIRRYQSEDLFSGAAKKVASWTSSFGQTNIRLTPGTGYAIWVATDENESRTFDFPKDAMSYDVYNKGGTSVAYTETIPSRADSYHFAFYDKFSQSNGKDNRSFDLSVENGDNTGYSNLLIANPFMSHLDFNTFYSENNSKVRNAFYVWNGNSFTATNQAYNEASGGYDSRYIAPQQSFVVLRNGAANVSTLRFTPAMSVANVGSNLRSASSARSPRLQLKVYRYGVLQSEAEIRYQPGASNGFEDVSDAWTLFAEDVKKTAVLYTLVDNAAASINTLGSLSEDIPLGIRTSEPGELKFEITGAESFDGDVYLIDVVKGGQAIELGTSTEYAFNNTTGDIIDRFYIRILGTGTGINDETTAHDILIYQENSVLYVKSDLNDPLLGVSLFDSQGRLLLQHTAGRPGMVSETSCALTIPGEERMVTVKVVSEKSQLVRKIFIK